MLEDQACRLWWSERRKRGVPTNKIIADEFEYEVSYAGRRHETEKGNTGRLRSRWSKKLVKFGSQSS